MRLKKVNGSTWFGSNFFADSVCAAIMFKSEGAVTIGSGTK